MKEELIGKEAEITESSGKTHKGTIVNETKNMLHLETKNKIKKFIKKTSKIKINVKTIEGEKIAKRPEDRIKEC